MMNKKTFLSGIVIVAGLIALTAAGKQTLQQQKDEIAVTITAKMDEFRAQKKQECSDRITAEAQRRYDEYVASLPPVEAAKPSSKSATKKVTKPKAKAPLEKAAPIDPTKKRGGAIEEGKAEDQKKRDGAITPSDPAAQKKRGGANKDGGGN